MKALKYTFIAVFVCWNVQLFGSDISEIEFKRSAYHRYEVSDIFGVAKLLTSIVSNSEQLKELFKNPVDILRATFLVGSIAAIVKISLLAVQGLSARIPQVSMRLYRSFYSWCMQKLNLPEGFDYEQLIMCEQMFEQVISVWCDQKTLDVEEQTVQYAAHWDYQRHFVQDMLQYVISFLEAHQQYYRAMQLKRGSPVMTTHVGDNRVDHVCYLVQSSISSLRHLVIVSEQTKRASEFDIEHVKRVARTIVILLKKLCAIIGGESMHTHSQAEYTIAGQSFVPITGLFDI